MSISTALKVSGYTLLLLLSASLPISADVDFIRGDVNGDGCVTMSDALCMIQRTFPLYCVGPRPLQSPCPDAYDVNDEGTANLTDIIALLNFAFLGGQPPAAPYPEAGPDPTEDGLGCEAYEVASPERDDHVVRLGDVEGFPGTPVSIPVFVTNSVLIEAYQLVVRCDPAVFTPREGREIVSLDGGVYVDVIIEGDKFNIIRFSSFDREERLLSLNFGYHPVFACSFPQTPTGEDTFAFSIVGDLSEDVEPGTVITLELLDTSDDTAAGSCLRRVELTGYEGEAIVPRVVSGSVTVVPGNWILRGEANSDGIVDMSDAIFILNWLFRGATDAPACLDAADANDDGLVDISDAITILQSLFLCMGCVTIAPPFPDEGYDVTPDALGSCL